MAARAPLVQTRRADRARARLANVAVALRMVYAQRAQAGAGL
jgi:hypothetical protein